MTLSIKWVFDKSVLSAGWNRIEVLLCTAELGSRDWDSVEA